MTEIESIELARAYVAVSNAHRVELILPMFSADAVYTSSAVGEFNGPAAIGISAANRFARSQAPGFACYSRARRHGG